MGEEQSISEPKITWSGLARILSRESPIVLVDTDERPLAHPISFDQIQGVPELDPAQMRVAKADYSQPWRIKLKKDIVDPNSEINLEELSELLHDIKKRSRIMFGDLHAAIQDTPHTLSVPTLLSDQRLRKQERHLKVIAESLRFSIEKGETKDPLILNGIVDKIEAISELNRKAKDFQLTGVDPLENVASYPSYDKARKTLIRSDDDPSIRAKKADRAQRLYTALIHDPHQVAIFSGQLVSDIVEVSSDIHYFVMLRQLQKEGVNIDMIRNSVRATVSSVSDWGKATEPQLSVAKSILNHIQPIIEYVRKFPHDETVNSFSRMDALTLESAICAGKTRMLLDFFRRIEGISSYEAVPLIRSDGNNRGHVLVYLSPKLSQDTLIEIDANFGSDKDEHKEFGCEVNIYQRDELNPKSIDNFVDDSNYFTEKMHLHKSGKIYSYDCVTGKRLHPYIGLMPSNRFESLNYATFYKELIEQPSITPDSRRILLYEMEYLLRHDWMLFQYPTSMVWLSITYQNDKYRDILSRGSIGDYMNKVVDGLRCIDQFRRISPMDPDGALIYSLWLAKEVVNQGPVEEYENRTVALYAEIERVLGNMFRMWPTEETDKLQKEYLDMIHETFLYRQANEFMGRKYASWEEASLATRDYLYDSRISPITAKALVDYRLSDKL